jgi:GR25 family glycosyltransferase involved in LPS biosynthesis
MRVGISVFFQHSFFSNGCGTVALSLAKAMKELGHTAVLVNTNGTTEWFEDCQGLKGRYERVHLTQWQQGQQKFDIFIDVDGFLNPEKRRQVAEKVVIFIRKPVALGECEHTVYPIQGPVRNLRDCDAIWTWEHFGTQDTHILEVLSEKPVFRLPYTWSWEPIESHTAAHPSWVAMAKDAKTWTCHIAETNQSTMSNSTLPIVIMGYTKTHTRIPLTEKYIVHNALQLNEQQFFKDNVYAHSKRDGLEAEFIGRQRVSDWRLHGKAFVLAHTRFVAVRAVLLDCLWNGIPLVHNSPWLQEFGYYYKDNSVKGAAAAIEKMVRDYDAGSGMFATGALDATKMALAAKLSVKGAAAAWSMAMGVVGVSPLKPVAEIKAPKTELVVGFTDLWADVNSDYNFWTLLLQEACSKLRNPVKVRGIQITDANVGDHMDVLFFGPFGDTWTRVPAAVPKVHITGENSPSRFGPGVYLNLGFDETDKSNGIYRFPLWIQYIDWFGADQERLCNPKSMPVDSVARTDLGMLRKKSKFCAFVVSNPSNSVRNEAFHTVNSYKKVDSAGRLFNNVGDALFTGIGGGGGGELKKLEFLRDYKFCITYENSRRDGYITEKFLAAKAAGCVPIYWGDMTPTRDFPLGSFIDANTLEGQNLINSVKTMDENEETWLAAATIPAIQVDKERKRLAEVAKLILEPLVDVSTLPNMLGAATTQEALAMGAARERRGQLSTPLNHHKWNGNTLLTTYATERFLPSLVHWLASAEAFMNNSTRISVRVYLGDDVDTRNFNGLRSEYPKVEFQRLPTKTVSVDGFPDLWDAQHFAWKIWIYKSIVEEAALENTLIWYMDSGSIIVRWPEVWLNEAASTGICMLEDSEQKNHQWCHDDFCKELAVTEEEKSKQQIVGGIVAFVAGARLPWKLFQESWKWAQKRNVIVGPKWAGIGPDGKPYGHRHDQSILSILRLRYNIPVHALETVYNHDSLRRTAQAGAALYVHRGQIKENDDFAPGIGDVHIINLPRRKDRLERFKANHGPWTKRVCLKPAYDGRGLTLTPALARLFMPNNFFWKKAVMGCALSHLDLHTRLMNEPDACDNYLVLEDDVKFQSDWLNIWNEASKCIPEDYDVLYLGGVLPPNKPALDYILEPVNKYWAKIKPNQMLGQPTSLPTFHFCTYAYIINRKGAKKIIEDIGNHGGYYTSADHIMCARWGDFTYYVMTPQVAGCYQDDDPAYANSQFNDFSRVDNFDSDLWNNDDRFSKEEVDAQLKQCVNGNTIPIGKALHDAMNVTVPVPVKTSGNIFTVGTHIHSLKSWEGPWLEMLFGSTIAAPQQLPIGHTPLDTTPTFIYFKQHNSEYLPIFEKYEKEGRSFNVIHTSDEYLNDPVHFYEYKSCKKIVRMYPRPNVPCPEKVIVIPLGPHWTVTNGVSIHEKSLVWSFYGTNWMGRGGAIDMFRKIEPNECRIFDTWEDSVHKGIKHEEYSKLLAKSVFIPCLRGQNVETYRFWEALEHGCIPIYIRTHGDDEYYNFISSKLPIVSIPSIEHALQFMESLLKNQPTLVQYRATLLGKWMEWKAELSLTCKAILEA